MSILARAAAAVITVVLATGAAVPIAQAAPDTERRAAFKPTLNASKTSVLSGRQVVFSGKVKPARKGIVVGLQKKVGDKWTTEARLKTNARGGFRYTDRPNTAGVRKYRVVVPRVGRTTHGVSKAVTVTVYAWKSLTQLQERSSDNTWQYQTSIGGTTYNPSYYGQLSEDAGFVDWNVFGKCTRLTARFGNNDNADLGSLANVSILEDGTSTLSESFGLGQSAVRTVDITGTFRLAFSWTSTNTETTGPDNGAGATLAVPKVLCAM